MTSPTIQRRRFALAIKEYRTKAKLGAREASAKLHKHANWVYELERGDFKQLRRPHVDAMLRLYGVESASERQRLWEIADSARQPGWWQEYGALVLPDLEAGAREVLAYEALCVPGLLQTEDYARAVLVAAGHSPCDVEQRVAARMRRQQIITRSVDPVALAVVIDESAISKVVGSPRVMRDQVRHLVELAHAPNVSIRIVAGAHPAMVGSFAQLGYDDFDPLVYLETPIGSGILVEDPREVGLYSTLHDRLTAAARSAADSVMRMASTADALMRQGEGYEDPQGEEPQGESPQGVPYELALGRR